MGERDDRDLGMSASISRRDFLNGVLVGSATLAARPVFGQHTPYYPPALTGLRGSHVGSFEAAHALAREHKQFATESPIIDGEYDWTGVKLVKGGGVVRLRSADPDLDGTISSSVWPVRHGVWNLVHLVGVPLKDAIRLASRNPATAVGIDGWVGSIAPGKRADFVVIDADVRLFATIVAGREVFRDERGVPADVEVIQSV